MKNSSTIIRNSLKRLGEGMGGADDSITGHEVSLRNGYSIR
jgi:hypothetical protein